MKKSTRRFNNIKTLCEKKGMTSLMLAKKIGTSAPHMSRLINGQSPLSVKWMLKISTALKVPSSKIAGLAIDTKFASTCDDTLLSSIMGWLLEASDTYKVKLSRQELTKITSFIYKEAVEQPLKFDETRYLSFAAVQIKQLTGK